MAELESASAYQKVRSRSSGSVRNTGSKSSNASSSKASNVSFWNLIIYGMKVIMQYWGFNSRSCNSYAAFWDVGKVLAGDAVAPLVMMQSFVTFPPAH
jgi:hypothetical protein